MYCAGSSPGTMRESRGRTGSFIFCPETRGAFCVKIGLRIYSTLSNTMDGWFVYYPKSRENSLETKDKDV